MRTLNVTMAVWCNIIMTLGIVIRVGHTALDSPIVTTVSVTMATMAITGSTNRTVVVVVMTREGSMCIIYMSMSIIYGIVISSVLVDVNISKSIGSLVIVGCFDHGISHGANGQYYKLFPK